MNSVYSIEDFKYVFTVEKTVKLRSSPWVRNFRIIVMFTKYLYAYSISDYLDIYCTVSRPIMTGENAPKNHVVNAALFQLSAAINT